MPERKGFFVVALIFNLGCLVAPTGLWAQEEPAEPRGVGLSVEPGGLLIQHVKPGETYDLAQTSGIALKISNPGTKPRTYLLSTHRPSEVGNRKWLEGYLEIPDPSWFWFEQDRITVDAKSDGYVKMFLKVPQGAQYDNQHWVVSIGVQGTPEPGEMLALAAFPRYQIETESTADIEAIPEGALGVKPSLLRFEETALGKRRKSRITLYNNETVPHRYTVSVKTIAVDPTREQIAPSPGYTWIPEPKWIAPGKKRVAMKDNQSWALEVRLKVPTKLEYQGQQWEALLWIEQDEGLPRFARIQIETTQGSGE